MKLARKTLKKQLKAKVLKEPKEDIDSFTYFCHKKNSANHPSKWVSVSINRTLSQPWKCQPATHENTFLFLFFFFLLFSIYKHKK